MFSRRKASIAWKGVWTGLGTYVGPTGLVLATAPDYAQLQALGRDQARPGKRDAAAGFGTFSCVGITVLVAPLPAAGAGSVRPVTRRAKGDARR